jgi:hypothetical protein
LANTAKPASHQPTPYLGKLEHCLATLRDHELPVYIAALCLDATGAILDLQISFSEGIPTFMC